MRQRFGQPVPEEPTDREINLRDPQRLPHRVHAADRRDQEHLDEHHRIHTRPPEIREEPGDGRLSRRDSEGAGGCDAPGHPTAFRALRTGESESRRIRRSLERYRRVRGFSSRTTELESRVEGCRARTRR